MTRRQLKLLTFLRDTQFATGITPSYDEMAAGIGLRSKSSIHRLLQSLQKNGHVQQRKRAVRHIEITTLPPILSGQCPHCGQALPKAEAA